MEQIEEEVQEEDRFLLVKKRKIDRSPPLIS
jgi:hypothetical protein